MRKPLLALLAAALVASPECGTAMGTAFHLGEGRYFTALHVVYECVPSASVVQYNSALDYAILVGPVIDKQLTVSCKPFIPGEFYLAVGYGYGYPEAMRQPWIASPFNSGPYHSFVGEAIPGMSGGPVLDEEGRVHGVVNMRWPARSLPLKATPLCGKVET
jgi:hypothetical protein